MSQPQPQQRPSAANGVRRRNDRDVGIRVDAGFRSDSQNWRSSQQTRPATVNAVTVPGHVQYHSSVSSATVTRDKDGGSVNMNKGGIHETDPHRMALLHFCTCLIGQHVDVQLKNGRVYNGIYHACHLPSQGGDFGVVLKYARLMKDVSVKGGKSAAVREAARKPPIKMLNVHSEEFVQIIAKDVSVCGDSVSNGRVRENKTDLLTDSNLSQGKQKDLERELKPWQPDDEAPRNLALDTTFQSHWNRNWDQFETNKALFGVESTFNEELYTTKLEKGVHMREREREAQRIAKEIEGTSSRNLHLAEERGARSTPELEALDEESRFSSVLRQSETRDVGEDDEDRDMDYRNQETFGDSGSPYDSALGTPIVQDSDTRSSRPSSADSAQTANGPAKRDPSVSLRDRRTGSIEKGELAALDSLADTHREHLRLRHLLVGDKSKRANKAVGSPYSSPVGRGSPLTSPLVGDPAAIQALNLDPSCPQVSEEVFRCDGDLDSRREFHEFKLQETAKKSSKKQREEQVNELKFFSESYKERTKKESEPRSPKGSSKLSGDPLVTGSRHGSQEGGARPSTDLKSSLGPSSTTGSALHAASATVPGSAASQAPQLASDTCTLQSGYGPANTNLSSKAGISSAAELSGLTPSVASVVTPAAVMPGSVQANSPSSGTSGGQGTNSCATAMLAAVAPSTATSVPAAVLIPSGPGSASSSSSVSPASTASSGSSTSVKKSTLNPNAKEFKLNPNAKVFTPSTTFNLPRPVSPMMPNQVYMQSGLPPASPLPAMPVGVNLNQYLQQQQPGQPSQYAQYGNGLGAGSVSGAPYLQQPPGAYVSGAGGPPVLQGQPSIKLPHHSQQQLQVVGPPYAQQQVLRYPPQAPPMQPAPAYLHPNGQLYPQQMMYSQPGLVYIYPQGMIQGQPLQGQPVPPQGPLAPQPAPQQQQQQKHRGGAGGMHYSGAPPFFPGQQQQQHMPQAQMSHMQQQPSQAPPAQGMAAGAGSGGGAGAGGGSGTATGTGAAAGQNGGSSGVGNGGRVGNGGKGGVGSFQQQ